MIAQCCKRILKTLLSHKVLHSLVPTYLSRFIFCHTHPSAPLYSTSNHVFYLFHWSVTLLVWFPCQECPPYPVIHSTAYYFLPRKSCSPIEVQCKSSFFGAMLHDTLRNNPPVPLLWSHHCGLYYSTYILSISGYAFAWLFLADL